MNAHHFLHPLRLVLTALVLLSVGAGLRSVAAAGSARGGAGPGSGPVAGPLEVFVQADVVSGPVGTLVESDLVVANSGDEPVRVLLLGRFTWPDGSTSLLRYGPPVTIDADGALVVNALSPLPADVGSGAGAFRVTAVVGPIGTGGRAQYPGALIASDADAFVLP